MRSTVPGIAPAPQGGYNLYDPSVAVTQIAAAPIPNTAAAISGAAVPPEGIHPDAGHAALPVPAGATAAQVALGDRIFHGQAGGGTCSGCHASDAKGTSLGPDLTKGSWLWSDGSLKALTETILRGVPEPKHSIGAMPPLGGAQLSKDEVAAVAAYVWAIGHNQH